MESLFHYATQVPRLKNEYRYTSTPLLGLHGTLQGELHTTQVIQDTLFFLHGEGPRSRCYGRTTALRLFVEPYDEDKDEQFSYHVLQVMEHQWNEIDRGETNNSEKNLSQCHFVQHKPHMD
jgi:hypothetical protein